MIEPEIAFADASGAMDNAEAMMKFVIKKALEDCRKDLEFCDKCYAVWKSTTHTATPSRRRRVDGVISTQVLREQRTYYKVDIHLRE